MQPEQGADIKSEPTLSRNILYDPYGIFQRYLVLFFLCFLLFGYYFIYDTPSALQAQLVQTMGINDEQYGLLYSVYLWPSVIFSFLGGYFIDWILGVRWGAIIFAAFIAAGQFVFAIGGYVDLFWIMVLGRFIFSIGGESIGIAQSTYTVKWFRGKELNSVFGIQLSFANAASTANQFAMLPIYNSVASSFGLANSSKVLGISLFISFLTCLFSVACGFALWWLDKRHDRYLDKQSEYDALRANNSSTNTNIVQPVEKVKITPKEILHFPLTFWLLCFVSVSFYNTIDTLVSFGELFYINKFQLTPYQANICNGLVSLISMFGMALCGIMIDFFGKNVQFIIISVVMGLVGHCLLAFTFWTPYIAAAILGCAYSLFASALWPSVAYIVPEHAIGTAYGVMQSVLNLGSALCFLLIGYIVDNNGYLTLELFFICGLSLSLGLSILLYFADYGRKGYLIMEGAKRRKQLSLKLL